ncbi:hypothetical protein BHE74_00027538 [Ensete ventricosum]|nr:hypothetical protein BHE74_00027538 [Ensete ventricosum]
MISLVGTSEHVSNHRNIVQLPLFVIAFCSRSLMANHNAVVRATHSGRVIVVSWCRPTTQVVASTHHHLPRNLILRFQPSRVTSTTLCSRFTIARRGSMGVSARGVIMDSKVERQELEDEEATKCKGLRGRTHRSQCLRSGKRHR